MTDQPYDILRNGLANKIRDVRFTPVRLHEGYEMSEVDALLDELRVAALEGRDLAPLVSSARFTPVRWREGYDTGEVDAFLADVGRGVA